jgi:hypothetical protein
MLPVNAGYLSSVHHSSFRLHRSVVGRGFTTPDNCWRGETTPYIGMLRQQA